MDQHLSEKILVLLELVIVLNSVGTSVFEGLYDSNGMLANIGLFLSNQFTLIIGLTFYVIPQKAIVESFLFSVDAENEEILYP